MSTSSAPKRSQSGAYGRLLAWMQHQATLLRAEKSQDLTYPNLAEGQRVGECRDAGRVVGVHLAIEQVQKESITDA
jgi:hypothetical protein